MQSAEIFFTILLVVHSLASTVRRARLRPMIYFVFKKKNIYGIPPAICRGSARMYCCCIIVCLLVCIPCIAPSNGVVPLTKKQTKRH